MGGKANFISDVWNGFLAEEKTSNESLVLAFSSEGEQIMCSITNQWL